MTERECFETLVEILELLFKDDDRMDQDTLFSLQDLVAEKLLDIAKPEWGAELAQKFPYVFKPTRQYFFSPERLSVEIGPLN